MADEKGFGDQNKAMVVRSFEYGNDEANRSLREEKFVKISAEEGRLASQGSIAREEHTLSRDRSRDRERSVPAVETEEARRENLIRNGNPDQMIEALKEKRQAAESAAGVNTSPKGLAGTFGSKADGVADEKFTPNVKNGPTQNPNAGPAPGPGK